MGEFSIGNDTIKPPVAQLSENVKSIDGKAMTGVVSTDVDQEDTPLSAYLKLMLILKHK